MIKLSIKADQPNRGWPCGSPGAFAKKAAALYQDGPVLSELAALTTQLAQLLLLGAGKRTLVGVGARLPHPPASRRIGQVEFARGLPDGTIAAAALRPNLRLELGRELLLFFRAMNTSYPIPGFRWVHENG